MAKVVSICWNILTNVVDGYMWEGLIWSSVGLPESRSHGYFENCEIRRECLAVVCSENYSIPLVGNFRGCNKNITINILKSTCMNFVHGKIVGHFNAFHGMYPYIF